MESDPIHILVAILCQNVFKIMTAALNCTSLMDACLISFQKYQYNAAIYF